ncbi:MAG: tetratricopeptide repeat protein [Hyphomicrobiaceae bacterium]
MIQDAQGQPLLGATGAAARHYDGAVRAYALSYGDTLGALDAALRDAPNLTMAVLFKAWVMVLANDVPMAAKARLVISAAREMEQGERERVHLAALAHAVEGHRHSATAVLDRYLLAAPHDLLAHAAAMFLDAFQGRFHRVRDRSARALPLWSKAQPGYGLLLAYYGFGLEEAGHYAEAETISRAAAKLEPHGYWPHHAVSHVFEMTGRPRDGLQWMTEREPLWSGNLNVSRVHIWWHKALFHMELGDKDAALAIYDSPILETQRPVGVSLTNSTALLWRLETLGAESGQRWQALADIWSGHADGRLCLFADIHAAMTQIRAGRTAELEALKSQMRVTASDGSCSAAAYRDLGLPLVAGLEAFSAGDHCSAVEHLWNARPHLMLLGGSYAQRDVIDWTMTEAAIRAGMRHVAVALANERIALRPESLPNKRFLAEAEKLAV